MANRDLLKILPGGLTRGLLVLIVFSLLADFLASDRPLVENCNGRISFPAFNKNQVWSMEGNESCTYRLFTFIRYNPYQIDTKNAGYKSPFDHQDVPSLGYRHWLGTDKIGRDVAAGLIHGAKNSIWIGLCTTLLGLLLGVPYGLFLGYYQDNGVRWNPAQVVVLAGGFLVFLYYLWYPPLLGHYFRYFVFYPSILLLIYFLFRLASYLPVNRYFVPIDLLGYRLLEWRKSIPALFLLLALVSLLTKPSILFLIVIMAFLAWADIARLVRAETLQIKSNLYVQSGIALGFSPGYLMRNYVIPGLKNSVIVIAMYMMAGSILLESTLSFLGLGLPLEEVSWGKMLAESRDAKAWWMAVFPGGCLIFLLFWLHSWSDRLGKK